MVNPATARNANGLKSPARAMVQAVSRQKAVFMVVVLSVVYVGVAMILQVKPWFPGWFDDILQSVAVIDRIRLFPICTRVAGARLGVLARRAEGIK